MSSPRRPVLVLFAVTCAILVGWFGWRIYGDYLVRADLSAARRSIALSDRATARDRLRHAAAIRPDHGEVQLLLGTMAIEDGHPDEAESAWAQVPEDSPYAPDAATYRARLAFRQDQFAHAEDLLKAGLRGKGGLALEARQALTALYKIEGRFDEAKKLILDGWQSYPDPARQVRELEVLGSTTPVPVAEVRRALEQAERKNPADDRVALGWANVAIRTGRIDEAKTRLDSCLNLRPDDPAVWRALLDWAEARQDPVEAERALHHLPEEALNPTQVLALQAWFAALEGDSEREKQAYEALVLRDPGYLKAWDRLSDLALQAGRTEQAARLRERRVEVSQARTEYTAQFLGGTSATDPIGTARVAETLGRWFEAATIWSTVLKADPTNSTAREAITRLAGLEANAPTGPKIAELVAELTAHPPSKRDSGPSGGPGITSNPTTPPIRFTERAEASGLRFTFDNGATPARQMPETMAGGVGLIDFDGDGWLDVFLPQGGSFPPPTDRPAPGGDRLFHNRGDGTFEDATDSSGLARLSQGFGHGVAVGDFDGDGHPDVFVTRWNRYSLYRNRGNGTFEDATVGAGLAGDRDWPTSAAWADLDRDGDLDLYVCHYLQWDTANPRLCFDSRVGRNSYCGPTGFASLPDHLFRNDGGRFTDVTAEAGIIDTDGRGLGVVVADLDGDGRLDLFVANDQSANFVWHNLGGMKFAEVGLASGLATNGDGNFQASMGVATADFDGDGKLDLAKTNFFNESMTLYQNRGAGLFADVTTATGLAAPTRFLLGFGASFADFDNDGWPDLVTTNGHIDDFRPEIPWKMPNQVLKNQSGRRFADVSAGAGPGWNVPRVGRGLARGDLDNDGRVDLLVLPHDAPLAYFHNESMAGASLTLALHPRIAGSDTTGAHVIVKAAGRSRHAWQVGGGSYQSASDSRVHFGLGPNSNVDQVEIHWPSGTVDHLGPTSGQSVVVAREGVARGPMLPGIDEDSTTPRSIPVGP